MIVVVILALGSSLAYGTSDFLSSFAARRLAVFPATLATYLFGTIVVAIVVLAMGLAGGDAEWSGEVLASGSVAAVFAIVGFVAFYGALAIGPMSLLSPAIALVYALVPISVAVALGQALSVLGWVAVALAVVATLLISIRRGAEGARVTLTGAVLGLVAGIGLGGSIVALDASPDESGLTPALLEMAGGVVLLALLMLGLKAAGRDIPWLSAQEPHPPAGAARPLERHRRAAWLAAVVGGVLMGAGNALLLLALHAGNLAVVSVLSSLYPLATVVLAAVVLKERISALQIAGITLAIVAAVLLSLA